MMQETEKNELFSDISTENSATINGGHGCGCNGSQSARSVSYGYGRSGHYYNVYGYNYPVRYNYRRRGSYVRFSPRTCY